ncbi:MAG: hypothetical protein ACI9FR_003304 [Cryomorphaceae bacterium]|jgi:hypothetical protein
MIRLLIYVCAFLLLANFFAYFWPDQANYAPHVYPQKADVNQNFLRLNKEIEDKYYSQPSALSASSVSKVLSDGDRSAVMAANCYRIGPFMHRPNYELAEAVLLNANVEYKKSKRVSKETSVFRVYLGPYSTAAEVADVRLDLKRGNVLDHFVRKEGDDQYIISLGIYTTQESASMAVKLFDGTLDSVKLKDEQLVLPDSFWLHFSVDEDDQIKSQLAQMDWGEQSAKMGKHLCQ